MSVPSIDLLIILNDYGATERNRTPNKLITNQSLYLLSYGSIWCFPMESSHSHKDFQPFALPTELDKQDLVCLTRLELVRINPRDFKSLAAANYATGT